MWKREAPGIYLGVPLIWKPLEPKKVSVSLYKVTDCRSLYGCLTSDAMLFRQLGVNEMMRDS